MLIKVLSIFIQADYWASILRYMTPILLATLGGLYNEKAGVLNLGLDGAMLSAAFFGYIGSLYSHSVWIGLLTAVFAGVVISIIHGYLVITLKGNQMVSSLGINMLALGVTGTGFRLMTGNKLVQNQCQGFSVLSFGPLTKIPFIGNVLFHQTGIVYFSLLMIPLTYLILYKTNWGLKIRGAGEYPLALDTVGINVYQVRYLSLIVSGVLTGLGGAAITLTGINTFYDNITSGRGFIAYAAIVFGNWNPFGASIGALIFGAGEALQLRLQALGFNVQYQLFQIVPYAITLIALILFMDSSRGPAASGIPYSSENNRLFDFRRKKKNHKTTTAPAQKSENILEFRNIRKQFTRVLALDDVSISIKKGEVHAILGENGAGKTTLMSILFGLYHADRGEILINGKKAEIKSPRDSINLGIGMVHQHFMLIPALTVWENVILGMDESRNPVLNKKVEIAKIEALCEKFDMHIDLNAYVWQLSVGEQQRVEILKSLYRGANVLILDEPTAVLTPQESEELFVILRSFVKKGMSIFFISHKLNEVMSISNRISVLRRGKIVKTVNTAQTDQDELVNMMVGRKVETCYERNTNEIGDVVLSVDGLFAKSIRNLTAVKNISFELHAGEILGIAGVDGNGQTELVAALTGMQDASDGKVMFSGEDVTNKSPRFLFERGMAHVPGDRHRNGLILDMSVKENFILEEYYHKPFSTHHMLRLDRIKSKARELSQSYDIRLSSVESEAGSLSGGNQQKIVLARMLDRNPKLLILVYPTRGLDIGAIDYIYKRIFEARNKGCAILLISTELDEILTLSDRIGVLYEGSLVDIVDRDKADVNEIGLLMAGMGKKNKQVEEAHAV